jgi:hypothetical protein
MRLDDLRQNLEELGDLSGITHDLNSDEIITGNQRCKAIDITQCKTVLIEKYRKPDKQGTVAIGYVVWNGAKYFYRQVKWNDEQRKKANITANSLTGEYDYLRLFEKFDVNDLKKWGLTEAEISKINVFKDKKDKPGEPLYPIVPMFSEKYSYILIMVSNEIDKVNLEALFELERQKSYKSNNKGVGHVIEYKKFIQLMEKWKR